MHWCASDLKWVSIITCTLLPIWDFFFGILFVFSLESKEKHSDEASGFKIFMQILSSVLRVLYIAVLTKRSRTDYCPFISIDEQITRAFNE